MSKTCSKQTTEIGSEASTTQQIATAGSVQAEFPFPSQCEALNESNLTR